MFDTLNEDRYIENVLEKIVLPYIKKHQKHCPPGKQIIYLHDNAPCHGTRTEDSKVHKWLKSKGIPVCHIPPNSPDVTPIELAIGRCKGLCKGQLMRTKEEVVAAYEKAWDSFPMEEWKKYMERLPKVLKQIKKDKGSNRNTK